MLPTNVAHWQLARCEDKRLSQGAKKEGVSRGNNLKEPQEINKPKEAKTTNTKERNTVNLSLLGFVDDPVTATLGVLIL